MKTNLVSRLLLTMLMGASLAAHAADSKDSLPSGVVVAHKKVGTGASPKASSFVTVNYRGTLPDGTEFDSSYKRGQPAGFPLGGVVPCWTQALQKMKVGGTATATAYGDHGVPGLIPPNTELTFVVELLGVKD